MLETPVHVALYMFPLLIIEVLGVGLQRLRSTTLRTPTCRSISFIFSSSRSVFIPFASLASFFRPFVMFTRTLYVYPCAIR